MEVTLNKDDQVIIDHVKYIRIDINMWSDNENESYDIIIDLPLTEFLQAYKLVAKNYTNLNDFLYKTYMSKVEISDDLRTIIDWFNAHRIPFYGEYLCDVPDDILAKYPIKYCKKSIE